MKRPLLFCALTLCSLGAVAQESELDQQETAQTQQMQQMQARMQTMQSLMQQIQATEDPEERQRLLQEHMRSMHDGMAMMGRMMRGTIGSGPGQGAGPAAGGARMRQCEPGDTECRINQMQMQQGMMSQRMGMMQQMMEQMTEHMMLEQGAEAGEPEGQN